MYDCWLFHEQIDALEDLAKAFPKTTIICDRDGRLTMFGQSEGRGRWKATCNSGGMWWNALDDLVYDSFRFRGC